MKGFRDPIVTTSCDHVIIRFIFPFSISKEILFSRFNCAFFSSNFPFLAFFSKSRRSSLRFLLLRSLPDRLCEGGRSIENHGWSFISSRINVLSLNPEEYDGRLCWHLQKLGQPCLP